MNKQETVSMDYIEVLLDHARQQGYDVPALLAACGLSQQALLEQRALSVRAFGRLYQRLIDLAQDESFGMLTGGKIPNGMFRMMCHCIEHCATLGEALRRCSDFYEICKGPRIKPQIQLQGELAVLHFVALDSLPADTLTQVVSTGSPTVIRTSLSIWHHFMSWMIGRRLPLLQAGFTFAEQPNPQDYELVFQCPLRFNQSENRLTFERHWLSLPLVQSESAWRGFLKTAPYQLLVMVNGDSSISARIRALFGRDFSRPLPGLEWVAEQLGLSVRTLRRHLAEEGTSYSQLKNDCRCEAARDHLNCPELSIHDVANLVGFDDPSPFIRAFRQWTGQTPGEYRADLLDA
ncbi:AraC family transcriptional regulator [Ferrimonas pelagia]|uniref:AraC family transcriptional regulator n=1 Tax=Ferrimonas pelagia TaxID=1177826 RepID=A0ABP9ENW8_9GAMM